MQSAEAACNERDPKRTLCGCPIKRSLTAFAIIATDIISSEVPFTSSTTNPPQLRPFASYVQTHASAPALAAPANQHARRSKQVVALSTLHLHMPASPRQRKHTTHLKVYVWLLGEEHEYQRAMSCPCGSMHLQTCSITHKSAFPVQPSGLGANMRQGCARM